MFFFIRTIFESLGLLFVGGIFILAETCLGVRKKEFEKVFSLQPPHPELRLTALFFFVFAMMHASEPVFYALENATNVERFSIFAVWSFVLTLSLLLFGIILPRVIGESSASSWFVYGLSRLAQLMTSWLIPLVRVLHFCLVRILKCLKLSLRPAMPTSDEEVIQMMDEGLHSGVFNAAEKEMVEGVLELDEKCAASLMTPRPHVVALDLDGKPEENWRHIISSGHSEFPVFKTTQDHIVGMVSVKALWANLAMTEKVTLTDVITEPLYVSATMTPATIIEEFRSKKCHTALVVNEFGTVVGILTLKDVIESIVGALPEREVRTHYPELLKQGEGRWLVDAMLDYKEVSKEVGISSSTTIEEENRYQTIGGFLLHHLGHVPHAGEEIRVNQFRFQIISMKQHRIEKISITVEP